MVVSYAYLKLLIFLPAILIQSSSSSTFLMMYSTYKLNKQGDNIQLWCTPFLDSEPVCCSMSSSNCCFLTCTQSSQEAGKVVWYSHLLKNFPQFLVTHTGKGFSVVNKVKVHVFLEFSSFFNDPTEVGNLISGFSVFSKSSLNVWNCSVIWP